MGLKSAFKLQNRFIADVRADTCASAHPAGICGSGGCVAGSSDSRTAYNVVALAFLYHSKDRYHYA